MTDHNHKPHYPDLAEPAVAPPANWPLPDRWNNGRAWIDYTLPTYMKFMLIPLALLEGSEYAEHPAIRSARRSLDGAWALVTVGRYHDALLNPDLPATPSDVWFFTQPEALALVAQPEWQSPTGTDE